MGALRRERERCGRRLEDRRGKSRSEHERFSGARKALEYRAFPARSTC